jgi:hypothetical protein
MRAAIHYDRIMADDALDETFVLRMTKGDRALLDALAARLPLKTTQIARLALRIGLQMIERDPSAIFSAGKSTKKGGR